MIERESACGEHVRVDRFTTRLDETSDRVSSFALFLTHIVEPNQTWRMAETVRSESIPDWMDGSLGCTDFDALVRETTPHTGVCRQEVRQINFAFACNFRISRRGP